MSSSSPAANNADDNTSFAFVCSEPLSFWQCVLDLLQMSFFRRQQQDDDIPFWHVWTILLPPTLALVYALTTALFLPYFRECPWGTHLPTMAPRLTILAAFVAAIGALLLPSNDNENGTAATAGNNSSYDDYYYYSLLLVLSIGISTVLVLWTRVHVVEGGPAPVLASMRGKVVLITGANTGIGKETSSQLVQQGAQVIMACRSADKAEAAKQEILQDYHQQHHAKRRSNNQQPTTNGTAAATATAPMIDVVAMDLSDLKTIQTAANDIKTRLNVTVDVLILNAGVMMAKHVITKDGYELVMQANHLGHFLLTKLLIDNGSMNITNDKEEGAGRVLTVTSSTYSFADAIDLNDLFCTKGERPYTLFGQYEMSKLANILFTTELDRRYPNLFTAAIHPGLVRTDVVRNMPWYLYYPNIVFAWALWTLQKTPAQGAWCTTYLAATPIKHLSASSGCYWVNRNVQELWPCAKDTAGAELLWRDSAKYVGVKQ